MPTKCEECGEKSYVIYLTCEYKKLCDVCYDKIRPKEKWEPDDLEPRVRRI